MSVQLFIPIVALTIAVIALMIARIKQTTTFTKANEFYQAGEVLANTIADAVDAAEQTLVKAAKEDNDGVLTKEDSLLIFEAVKTNVINSLSHSAYTVLTEELSEEGFQLKIENGIEALIKRAKSK